MKITTLIENTACVDGLEAAHGLSMYIETPAHSILFDAGPSDAFLNNACALGVDVAEADTAVISHGHYDHGGGLAKFLTVNSRANIYIRKSAFGGQYAKRPDGATAYIGLDKALENDPRMVFTGDTLLIDAELTLFSSVSGRECWSHANDTFLCGDAPDAFVHEQSLIVTANGKRVLFSGCAHCGIVNMLSRARELAGGDMDAVFSGFHLTNPGLGVDEPESLVRDIAKRLASLPTVFYTGHCTGDGPYSIMREIMGDKLQRFSSGSVHEI